MRHYGRSSRWRTVSCRNSYEPIVYVRCVFSEAKETTFAKKKFVCAHGLFQNQILCPTSSSFITQSLQQFSFQARQHFLDASERLILVGVAGSALCFVD